MRSYSVTGIFHVGEYGMALRGVIMAVRYDGAVSSLVLKMGLRVGVSSLL
jgi:hypothetical protein